MTTTLDRSQRAEIARAARREEILDAARRVFAGRGFSGTTIADIADEAHIALGTIYLYFASKDDVFAALNQRLSEIITRAVVDIPVTGTFEERVRSQVYNVFAACGANRDLVQLVVLNTDRESEVTKRLRNADEHRVRPLVRMIEAGITSGTIRDGDALIMTKLIMGTVSIAVYLAYVVSDGKDAATYKAGCADMVIGYLTPPAGGKRTD